MKRVLTAIAVVAITAAPAMADLELIKGRFYQKGEYTDQVFTLKNDTKRIIKHVTAKCGVFDNEELIDTGDLDFENVPPGEKVMTDLALLEGETLRELIVKLNRSSDDVP